MYILSVQYSCAVVSVFLFGGKANLVLLTLFYSTFLALTDGQRDGQRNEFILVGLATLMGSSRFILIGLATLTGSSRFILVGLATLTGSSRFNPGWAG
jgi:hypothetical protein